MPVRSLFEAYVPNSAIQTTTMVKVTKAVFTASEDSFKTRRLIRISLQIPQG
jgi:hypothetical protein